MLETIAVIVAGALGGVIAAIFTSGQYKQKVDGQGVRLDKVEVDVEEVKEKINEQEKVTVRIDESLKAINASLARVERQNIGLMKTISRTRVSKSRG